MEDETLLLGEFEAFEKKAENYFMDRFLLRGSIVYHDEGLYVPALHRPLESPIQNHPITVGNRTCCSARTAAKLERQRDGIVQHVRSNPYELYTGGICSSLVFECMCCHAV